MRAVLILLALSFGSARAGYRYLELRLSPARGDSLTVPLYLAVPESLGALAVLPVLTATPEQANRIFQRGDWQLKPLKPAEKRFLLGARAMLEGRLLEAKDNFTATRNSHPSPGLQGCLRIDAAALLYIMGLPDEAEKDLLRALNADNPAAEGAWRNLYSIYLGRRNFVKAHGLVEDILQASPKNKWAILAKGYLLRMLRPEDEWERFLKEKSSWRESLFEIQIAYGRFLKEKGQLAEAVKYYNRGLEGEPANGFAWLDLADAYHRLGYLVFAEKCLRSAFRFGVHDPYIYELYARILWDFGQNTDSEQASAAWRAAERILEEGFPHDLQSRGMARLLYHLYCRNGKVEAAANLRAGFWFHFTGPAPPLSPPKLNPPIRQWEPRLTIRWSEISFPLAQALQNSDFFEPF